MRFGRSRGYLSGMIVVCLLTLSACSRGGVEDTTGAGKVWRNFGTLLLYRLGTDRCPSIEWLGQEFDVVHPDSGQAVGTAEFILMKAFDGYGQDAIAVEGRIPLDMNPQCILGLYLTERFSGARLGDWGRRQFERCIEQACLVAMPRVGSAPRINVEAELLAADGNSPGPFHAGAFAWAEAPYLYLYLINNAGSVDTRNKARERLARCLRQEYGLEPGLRQYSILFDQSCKVDGTWLETAIQLERIGAHSRAKKVYGQILRNTESVDAARRAFEGLAHVLLQESRQREARTAWGVLARRFPDVEPGAEDTGDFLNDFQVNREETSKRLISELAQTTREPQALQVCRLFNALWTPEEAPQQWQAVIDRAEPGSLAHQFGRVFLARAMLGAGNADASQAAVRELTEAVNPFVQAQSIAVSAEIAQAKGNVKESVRLYSRAIQIDRPTLLPSWCKGLVQIQSLDAGTPTSELQAQTLFLRGYNDLIDGDFATAADSFGQVASDPHSLPTSLQGLLPCMMMLACLGSGDYTEAEGWGHQALEECRKGTPDDETIGNFPAKSEKLDMAVAQLMAKVRDESAGSSAASMVLEQAIEVCTACTILDLSGSNAGGIAGGVQSLYVRTKKRHIARVLTAEHGYARQRLLGSGMAEYSSDLDPLLFAAQVLSEESFGRIKENLVSASDDERDKDRMYGFAVFTHRIDRLDLTRSALDVVAGEQASATSAKVLEDVAQMYLTTSSHQKAIDTYERIARNSKDPSRAKTAQLKIINIYAEDLQRYDKAIQECEEFVRTYPDSLQASQVEFLIGRFAYLTKDYPGAVGQLDGFQKRYPEHPQVGQAMMLAALSQMGEGNTDDAINRFRETIRRYPDGNLAARSKFLIGYAQISEQQYHAAIETFKQLLEQFPQSQYVPQARSLLDRLSKVSQ